MARKLAASAHVLPASRRVVRGVAAAFLGLKTLGELATAIARRGDVSWSADVGGDGEAKPIVVHNVWRRLRRLRPSSR